MDAACIFGAKDVKISNLNWGSIRPKIVRIQPSLAMRTRPSARFDGLVVSRRSATGLVVCRCSPPEVTPRLRKKDEYEGAISSAAVNLLIPDKFEAADIVSKLCKKTSVTEFHMERDSTALKDYANTYFKLSVRAKGKDLTGKIETAPPPVSAPLSIDSTVKITDEKGSVASPSLAISNPEPSSGNIQTLLDIAADEGLVIFKSPTVGYFRRSQTIIGKRAPPSFEEKQIVEEGQVLCFIEQLDREIPVQSDISGEIVKILRKDGDLVSKGAALFVILRSQPGIETLSNDCQVHSNKESDSENKVSLLYLLPQTSIHLEIERSLMEKVLSESS